MWLTQGELRSESSILAAFLARDLGLFSAEWHRILATGARTFPILDVFDQSPTILPAGDTIGHLTSPG